MIDLASPKLIKLKGGLFLLLGALSGAPLVLEQPRLRTCLLLAITVWAFCRFYYFAFYVIEHYVDPAYRFSGFLGFVRYLSGGGKLKNARAALAGPVAIC